VYAIDHVIDHLIVCKMCRVDCTVIPILQGNSHQRPPVLSGEISRCNEIVKYY